MADFPVYTQGPRTAADWTALNPILPQFTFGLEIDPATGQYTKAKFGDGRTAWNDLGYWSPGGPVVDTGGTFEAASNSPADGVDDEFTFTGTPVCVFRNGVNETRLGTIDGSTFTFDAAPDADDDIEAIL